MQLASLSVLKYSKCISVTCTAFCWEIYGLEHSLWHSAFKVVLWSSWLQDQKNVTWHVTKQVCGGLIYKTVILRITYNRGASYNHCCSGKAIYATYSEGLFIDLGIKHAMHMSHIVICGLSGSAIFFQLYPVNSTILGKKVIERKMCVLIFSTKFRNISHSK